MTQTRQAPPANTTQIMTKLSNEKKSENKPPHYVSLSFFEMMFSQKAFEDDRFAKEIKVAIQLALKSENYIATISIGGITGVIILDPKHLKEIFEKYMHCLNTKETIPLFNHHFKHSVMSFKTDDPMWEKTRAEIRESVIQLKRNPKKIIELAKKLVKRLSGKTEFNSKDVAREFPAEVVLNGFLDIATEKLGPERIRQLTDKIDLGIAKAVTLNSILKLALEGLIPFYRPKLPSDVILKEGEKMLGDILLEQKDEIWREGNNNWATRKAKSLAESNADLVNDLCFLLTAGAETTSKFFEFTLLAILNNPKVYEKIMQELNQLGPADTWNEETFKKMPYFLKVVLESLRMYPPLPLQKIKVDKTFTLSDGTVIYASNHIFISTQATQHLEESYKNPNEFNPDREEFAGHKFDDLISKTNKMFEKFRPFGMGIRSCPGAPVATLEVIIALAHLFEAYELKLSKPWDPTIEGNIRTNFGSQPWNVSPIEIKPRRRFDSQPVNAPLDDNRPRCRL